jgi:taurine dioxygenase
MDIRSLSAALGAEVTGIDLNEPPDQAVVEALHAAFAEHLVLVVRDQKDLTPEAQVRFCEIFGPQGLRSRPAETRREGAGAPAGVMFVSNRKEDGKFIGSLPEGEMMFHIDQCYVERPARASCLYAITVPDVGGDTLFGNLCAAYDALPDDLKTVVDDHKALNIFSYDSTLRDQVAKAENSRRYVQPMRVRHSVTGRYALYVNRLMTFSIEGMADEEAVPLLARLFDHQEQPEFIYSHKWRPNDLLIWDNQSTVHARTDFDPTKDRHLRRFTVAGGPLRT